MTAREVSGTVEPDARLRVKARMACARPYEEFAGKIDAILREHSEAQDQRMREAVTIREKRSAQLEKQ